MVFVSCHLSYTLPKYKHKPIAVKYVALIKNKMKNILIAVDLKNGDQALLDQGARLASVYGAKVWIIHVAAPEPDFVGFDAGPAYVRQTLADDLRHEHQTLHQYSVALTGRNIHAESLMVQGPTVQTIFDEAKKLEADMIILGSHRHNFLSRVFGQEVTHQIISQSTIPMLIVPLVDKD
jgi:nucleotide-binding universal stress UspA family protein